MNTSRPSARATADRQRLPGRSVPGPVDGEVPAQADQQTKSTLKTPMTVLCATRPAVRTMAGVILRESRGRKLPAVT